MKVKFKEWTCLPIVGRYSNGRKAINLVDHITYEPIATATVNIEHVMLTSWDHVFIKEYSENEGMTEALIKANIIYPLPYKEAISGFVTITDYKLTPEAVKLWDDEPEENDPTYNLNLEQ